MKRTACERHGLIQATDTCPHCSEPLLDLDDEGDHFYLESRALLSITRRERFAIFAAVLVLFVVAPIALAWLDVPDGPFVTLIEFATAAFTYASIVGLGFVLRRPARIRLDWRVTAAHRARAWRTLFRVLTGTPIFVAALLVAVHVVVGPFGLLKLILGASHHVLETGDRLWTLVTANFVHEDEGHLFGNVVTLVWLGAWLDLRVGRLRTAVTLLLTGVAGALLHVLLSDKVGIGASGMVYGVFGAVLVVMPRMTLALRPHSLALPAFIHVGVFAVGQLVIDVLTAQRVSWQGHLGGLIAGLLLGAWLRHAPKSERFRALEIGRG